MLWLLPRVYNHKAENFLNLLEPLFIDIEYNGYAITTIITITTIECCLFKVKRGP